MSESAPIVIRSHSPAETLALGRRLGQWARPGDVFALVGPLGAGKTQLVKGIASGLLAPDDREVQSPTYVLVREYEGRMRIFHLDLYRLTSAHALSALGFDEMCEAGGLVIVEWADRAAQAMPANATWVEIAPVDDSVRDFTLRVAAGRPPLPADLR